MKVKPFVAATLISGLGLVGSAAIAATNQSKGPAYDAPSTCGDYSSIVRGNSVVPKNGFVDLGTTPGEKAPAPTVKGPAYDRPLSPGVPLSIGMIANVDAYYSMASQYIAGVPFNVANIANDTRNKSYADLYVRNANLFLQSNMGIVHGTVNFGWNNGSAFQTNGGDGADQRAAFLNEAYISLYKDCFDFPVYLTVGRKYINYGDYDVYSIAPTLTQYMTQVNGAGVELGFVAPLGGNAFFGNITGFGGPDTSYLGYYRDRHPQNFSVKLGMQGEFSAGSMAQGVRVVADASYINSVADLSYYNPNGAGTGFSGPGFTGGALATDRQFYNVDSSVASLAKKNGRSLGGINAHLGFNVTGGDLQGTALDINFSSFMGTPYGYVTAQNATTTRGSVNAAKAKGTPWALSLAGTYQVDGLPLLQSASLLFGGGYSHNAGLNIDGTGPATGLNLPAWQMHLGLGMGITKSLTSTLMYQYNAKPKYTATNNGNAPSYGNLKNSNVIMLRFGLDV